MTRKARLWSGLTILAVIVINYAIIGVPLIRMNETIKVQTRSILLKQAKSGQVFNGPQDEYLLNVFRNEKGSNDRKILVLNCVSSTLGILALSWTIFGMMGSRKKKSA